MSSLVEKYENQHLHRCQSRVADEGWHITEREMGEMTFILEYDFIKVGTVSVVSHMRLKIWNVFISG